MKMFCLFFVLTLLAVASTSSGVADDEICKIELYNILDQYYECRPIDYRIDNVIDKMDDIAKLQLPRDDMPNYIKEFCLPSQNVTACYKSIPAPIEHCQNSDNLINKIHQLKFSDIVVNFMCDNEGSRFNDMLSDDGPACYARNDKHIECMVNQIFLLNLDMDTIYIEGNSCNLIQVAKHCLYAYDSCENKSVKYHITELNEVLSNKYKC